jgi:DsbC/DsbD-like thiol-disulfide interchange protein
VHDASTPYSHCTVSLWHNREDTMSGVFSSFVLAMAIGAADGPIATKHLTVSTSASAAEVAPGARVSLLLDVTPRAEMHVYAPEQKDYIPISLTLDATDAVKAHVVRFPPPEKFVQKDLGETQRIYAKPFRIVQDVTVARTRAVVDRAGTAGATVTIKGTLKYQACDNTICYAPVTVPVAWTLALKRPVKVTP